MDFVLLLILVTVLELDSMEPCVKIVRVVCYFPYVVAICLEPCQNGGTCTDVNFCTCTNGFTGQLCEVPPPVTTGSTTGKHSSTPTVVTYAILGLIGLAGLAILVVAVAIIIVVKRSKAEQPDKEIPLQPVMLRM